MSVMSDVSPSPHRHAPPRWLQPRLVIGIVLVLGSVLLGAVVIARAGQTERVLAATRDLAAGTVLAATDVAPTAVRVPDRAVYLPAAQDVTGRRLVAAVFRGQLLPAAAVQTAPAATTLSVPLDDGLAPPLRSGQRIELWLSTTACASVVLLGDVTVQAVSAAGGSAFSSGSGQNVVLSVDSALAGRVVTALAFDGASLRAGVLSGLPEPTRTTPCPRSRPAIRPPTRRDGPAGVGGLVRGAGRMKVPVLSAAGGEAWEARLIAGFDRCEVGVEVVRRCVDLVELIAAAGAGLGRVALIDAQLRRLDADAVDRLHLAGVVPVGVVLRDDPGAPERLRALGVHYLLPADAEPSVAAAAISAALTADPERARLESDAGLALADPVRSGSRATESPGSVSDPEPALAARGSLIAVWGPTGAPGRTTVAIGLADELARAGRDSLLVDADVYGGVVAAVLGLLDDSPGLAAASRHVSSRRLDRADLAGLCWQVSPGLRVLTGLPLAQRWPELRPHSVLGALAMGRELADFVVVDCGFNLEADEEISFDSVVPRRNGVTLGILGDADVVLAVGAADPIGMQRLIRGLDELGEAGVSAPVWVVLNKVRRVAVPGDPGHELSAALERFAGRSPAALLPYDRDGLDTALALGRTLGEVRPASPLRVGLGELAQALAGSPAPVTRRAPGGRRRRRRG